ncbi:hypothetical protein [Streptomyces rugosispiralis]|uniref:Transposase n=1 Tax=Streptomyces rugosispiralis TaxID=2967341 RepID=A0ABT1VD49_9ACTN|nr:hypothetical protein [Streptomyces rugosispiralis]MCQ8194431.1 hypothetical protein [Streptomyces rugosispiralis]
MLTQTQVPEPAPMQLPPAELPCTQIVERTPPPLRGRPPAAGRGLDDQRHRPPVGLRPQDRAPLPRHRLPQPSCWSPPATDDPTASWNRSRAYLNARFTKAEGQVSGTCLFLEIRERGYRRSRQVVRKHLAALRAGTAEPVRADIPSPRKIISWIMRPRDPLTESQEKRLLQVRLACPDITRACDLARAFADLMRHQHGHLLPQWIR